jgi:hypothetical protein
MAACALKPMVTSNNQTGKKIKKISLKKCLRLAGRLMSWGQLATARDGEVKHQ